MKDYNKEIFAHNLKKHMIKKDIDRYKLCEDLGFKYSTVCEWLSAKKMPRMNKIELLADYFNTTPAYLMGWDIPRYGKRLKEAKSAYKVDLKTLSQKTGLPEAKLKEFENDETVPSKDELTLIAQTYGLTLGDFLWIDFEKVKADISSFDKIKPNASIPPQDSVRMIPVYESVSAGFGAHAEDMVTGYMPLYIVSDSEAENTIVIKVQGDSMYPKIENGDSIQVLRQDFADNGQVAVLLIDGEDAVVKQFFHDRKAKTVTLHSFNPDYKDRVFDGIEMTRLRVLGVAKKVIKEI